MYGQASQSWVAAPALAQLRISVLPPPDLQGITETRTKTLQAQHDPLQWISQFRKECQKLAMPANVAKSSATGASAANNALILVYDVFILPPVSKGHRAREGISFRSSGSRHLVRLPLRRRYCLRGKSSSKQHMVPSHHRLSKTGANQVCFSCRIPSHKVQRMMLTQGSISCIALSVTVQQRLFPGSDTRLYGRGLPSTTCHYRA